MRRIVRYYESLGSWGKALVSAAYGAVAFVAGVGMKNWMSAIAARGNTSELVVQGCFAFMLLVGALFAARLFVVAQEGMEREEEVREATLVSAYSSVDRVVAKRLSDIREANAPSGAFVEALVGPPKSLGRLVEAAYDTFESAYGEYRRGPTRIEFEVTFMTRSFRDGGITIAAWANREGRAPRSMVDRAGKPSLYDGTVTAAVYREERPCIHIVEDTVAADDYVELYVGQKQRIRSSIVVPVLSDANVVLGTLVVHCDKTQFFRKVDEKYWADVAEVFTKRLALERMRLDEIAKVATGQLQWPTSLAAQWF